MNRIKKLREELGLTQPELGEKLDISARNISHYETEKRQMNNNIVAKIANFFNVSIDYLLGTTDDRFLTSKTSFVPLLGIVKAGYDYLAQENIIGRIEVENDLIKDNETYFALKVKGDSMYPIFVEDDIVIVKKQEDFENNSIVVAIINNDEATIKKGKKNENGIVLMPINNNYDPVIFSNEEIKNNEVIIVGVVKKLMRDF